MTPSPGMMQAEILPVYLDRSDLVRLAGDKPGFPITGIDVLLLDDRGNCGFAGWSSHCDGCLLQRCDSARSSSLSGAPRTRDGPSSETTAGGWRAASAG